MNSKDLIKLFLISYIIQKSLKATGKFSNMEDIEMFDIIIRTIKNKIQEG